jgi:Fe-S-cluster containining protein
MQNNKRDSCIRCGTCCVKGGPTLHHEDKDILRAGYVRHEHLVTIRKGELMFDPRVNALCPTDREMIKIRGKGSRWTCRFFDEANSTCTIYEHRLLECRLLKCWDPAELLSVIGKDTIVRADIINPGDPVLALIAAHEQECPVHEVNELIEGLSTAADNATILARLTHLTRQDQAIRAYAVSELGLSMEYSFFVFGRPLSQILSAHGISIR